MPVDDHPVHAKTVKAHGSMNGCHNTERTAGYWAPDGYTVAFKHPVGTLQMVTPKMRWIPDVMSVPCKYDLREHDTGCKGCKK